MVFSHPIRRVDDQFLKTAPIVVTATVDLDAPPAAVFEALGSDEMWSWMPILDRLRWVTPRPLGEGAVRTLRIGRFVEVEEEFYRWEEGRRATFCVTSASRPALKALAEDFLLEPTSRGTRLTWVMALDPGGRHTAKIGKVLGPLLAPGNTFAIGGIKKIIKPQAPVAPQREAAAV